MKQHHNLFIFLLLYPQTFISMTSEIKIHQTPKISNGGDENILNLEDIELFDGTKAPRITKKKKYQKGHNSLPVAYQVSTDNNSYYDEIITEVTPIIEDPERASTLNS